MRHARIMVLLGCALAALALVACDQERGGPRVVGEDGTEIEITATPTETGTATIVATGEPTGTPTGTATSTATSEATGTPSATPTGTPAGTSTPSSGTDDDDDGPGLSGVPYSTSDVRAAVQDAGRTFLVDDEREPICPNTSVPETVFWAAESAGSDFGPNWAIWVYPDEEAREADWELEDGQLTSTTDDCELPTGFNYFNANVVMAFVSWQTQDSESTFDADRTPREDAALEAFLELGGAGEDAEED